MFKPIINLVCFLILSFNCTSSRAQATNDYLLDSMVNAIASSELNPIDSLTGYSRPGWETAFSFDTASNKLVRILDPEISYRKDSGKLFVRKIVLKYEIVDSVALIRECSFSDTLSKQALKHIRKESSKGLKGTSPFLFNQVFIPIIGITTGISVIVSLFYLRS